MSNNGWIGVDLDGTLALYDTWRGIEHIGAPIKLMADRVRAWHMDGREVRIFTARVAVPEPQRSEVIKHIKAWLRANSLPDLEITNVKDFGMVELWDDRAVSVVFNTGEIAGIGR